MSEDHCGHQPTQPPALRSPNWVRKRQHKIGGPVCHRPQLISSRQLERRMVLEAGDEAGGVRVVSLASLPTMMMRSVPSAVMIGDRPTTRKAPRYELTVEPLA